MHVHAHTQPTSQLCPLGQTGTVTMTPMVCHRLALKEPGQEKGQFWVQGRKRYSTPLRHVVVTEERTPAGTARLCQKGSQRGDTASMG